MTAPRRHHSIASITDMHPVRPGTSAALTARTIDATVHPPIVRAQEAVAAFIPRVEAPIRAAGSPALIGLFGATVVLLWVAHRSRFRPSGLVFSAMLMLMLTSFHPLTKSDAVSTDQTLSTTQDAPDQIGAVDIEPQMPEPPSIDDGAPTVSDEPEVTPEPDMPMPPTDGTGEDAAPPKPPTFEIPPELMERMMSPTALMRVDKEMMRHDREQLRASLERLAVQLRKEARRNARRYYRNW